MHSLVQAEVDGARLTEEEIIANCILTMIGGQETSTNLIGSGLLTLLRHPEQMRMLLDDPSLIPSAVEELLRYREPHPAYGARGAGRLFAGRQADPARPVRGGGSGGREIAIRNASQIRIVLDVKRGDKGHLAFGWAAHFCFGAPLARIEGQIAFSALLRRLKNLELASEDFVWRENFGLRGLSGLPVRFDPMREDLPPARFELLHTQCTR